MSKIAKATCKTSAFVAIRENGRENGLLIRILLKALMDRRRSSFDFDVILQSAFASLKFNNNRSATLSKQRSFGPCGCQNRLKCIQLRLIRPVPQQSKRRQTDSSKTRFGLGERRFGSAGREFEMIISVA
jgi:hypothetical protein